MNNKLERYQKYIFLGITIIALGVTFSTVFGKVESSLGIIFIAVGGLFFIIGMNMKKKIESNNTDEQ